MIDSSLLLRSADFDYDIPLFGPRYLGSISALFTRVYPDQVFQLPSTRDGFLRTSHRFTTKYIPQEPVSVVPHGMQNSVMELIFRETRSR
jgi:hypothetical protein